MTNAGNEAGLIERLRTAAEATAAATQMMADAKSQRNQSAGDVGACYEGLKKEQTNEWQAADLIATLAAERDRLREAAIEECAKIAEAHIGSASKQRLARGLRLSTMSPDAIAEVQAEERGEDIAAELIAKRIRAALHPGKQDAAPNTPTDWQQAIEAAAGIVRSAIKGCAALDRQGVSVECLETIEHLIQELVSTHGKQGEQ